MMFMKKISTLLILIISVTLVYAGSNAKTGDLQYVQNQGQWQNNILFATPVYGGNLYLEKDRFTWGFSNSSELGHFKHEGNAEDIKNFIYKKHAFRTHFQNSNPDVKVTGENKFSNYYNYFIGKDETKWKGAVPAFGAVRYSELYPGTDLLVYSQSNSMKYDFILAPNADASQIRFKYEGLKDLRISGGNLELVTSINTIVEMKPIAYQIISGVKTMVECDFILESTSVSFSFPNGYDKNYELTIDPAILIFASYSGSTADNWGYSATYDAAGNLYGAGITFDDGYPLTVGAFQENYVPGVDFYVADITISKFTPDGTSLIYSTYCGGSSNDLPYSLIVNSDNELIVFGSTGSENYPVTAGSYDNSFNGGPFSLIEGVLYFYDGSDAFITKFNVDGTDLIGSTFLGGTGTDALNEGVTSYNYADHARGEVTNDILGNIYVASCTRSADLPVTGGVFQTTLGGQQDGFVAKLNEDLSDLVWCSFIGGSSDDAVYSIKKMNSSKFVVCGGTASNNFPTTPGALNETYKGGSCDGFVMTIESNASDIVSSTYIGTNSYDQTMLTEIDGFNSVFITGQTLGAYPIVGTVYENPGSSQYITKLDSTLSTMEFSTVFGNGDNAVNLSPTAFLVDNCNFIYVSGWGGSVNQFYNPATGTVDDMPITGDAFQSTTDGSDFYLVVFEENMASLVYSTYFGGPVSGEHVDGGTSRFDKSGVVYQAVCAGCGSNDDFPTTDDVVSNTNNSSNCNLGVFKFALTQAAPSSAFTADPISGCFPIDVEFENNSSNAAGYNWDFGDGSTSTDENPAHTYDTPGTYTVTLIANSTMECVSNDTSTVVITVYDYPEADFTFSPNPATVFTPTNFTDESFDAVEWYWEFGDGFTSTEENPVHQYPIAGIFEVCLTVTNEYGCENKICDTIIIEEISILDVPNAFSPNGDGVNDIFIPLNYGLSDFEFKIYNRWGELIFISNDPVKGWNGIYNGVEQELDVYVYVVSGKGLDNVDYFKQGNFTLVR